MERLAKVDAALGEGRCESTVARYRAEYDRLLAFCKERRVRDLDQIDLTLFESYRALRKEQGTAEKNRYHESIVIKQLVNWAHTRRMIAENPLKQLKLAKAKPKPQACFTLEQVEAILNAAREPARSMLAVLAFTGMRVGELRALEWSDVDPERNVIHIRQKEGWKPKSGNDRALPLHPRLRGVMDELPRAHRWVFTAGPSDQFPEGGNQINPGHLLSKLKTILRRLGIKGKLHTFRHFFISHCANNGVEPFKLMRWVGHADLKVILNYYTLNDAESQRAMQRISFGE